MVYLPTGSKVHGGGVTHREESDLISLLCSFKKESRLKICKYEYGLLGCCTD
jgi:hypothetical protein